MTSRNCSEFRHGHSPHALRVRAGARGTVNFDNFRRLEMASGKAQLSRQRR
jgi:hypothetical protein